MSQTELYTSLADLAAMEPDSIAAVKTRLQAAGIYIVSFTEVGPLKETLPDDPTKSVRIGLNMKGVIDYFEPLGSKGDDDAADSDLIGKTYNEYYTIWANELAQSICLLKGKFAKAHLPAAGRMGGVEGTEGWLDRLVGQRVAIRVTHKVVGDDTRSYTDWLGMQALAKLGIPWDDLGREPMDIAGNVIERVGQ